MGRPAGAQVEFRYYQTPRDSRVLALLGEGWRRRYGEGGPGILHFHNLLEIGLCHEGEGLLVLGEERVAYGPGTLTVIPPKLCHTTVARDGQVCFWEYLFIDLPGLLADLAPGDRARGELMIREVRRRGAACPETQAPALGRAVRGLMEELRRERAFQALSVKGLLLSLLAEAARIQAGAEAAQEPPAQRHQLAIREALGAIEAHLAQPLTVRELAARCHLSEPHFRRVFKAIMGVGPQEYLNLARVEAACDWLRETEESIQAIALRAGYPSQTTFNRNFRRVTGVTPLAWRRGSYEFKLRNYRAAVFQGWR